MSAPSSSVLLRPTKGVHAVVDHARLPLEHVITCHHPRDDRVLFAIPWGDRTYLGTTDTDFEGDPADVYATREDIEYLLEAANTYFPKNQLSKDDVISTWAGIRPLIAPSHDSIRESAVSREHEVIVGADGMITIAGGKLTTFRRMAGEVVDTAVRLLKLSAVLRGRKIAASSTDEEPLPGGVGWPEDDDHEKVAKHVVEASSGKLSIEIGRHLAGAYGMRALDVARLAGSSAALAAPLVNGRPEIAAQVDFAVDEELAASLSDVMIRRTQLFYRDHDQGLGVSEKIAHRMGELLGWDEPRTRAEIADYASEVAASRRWRDG
jgi:glycerol-3-phosphate dehydrogenase